jgi:hypothetical protein
VFYEFDISPHGTFIKLDMVIYAAGVMTFCYRVEDNMEG